MGFFSEIALILKDQLLLANRFWRHDRLPDGRALPHTDFVFSGLGSLPLGLLTPEQGSHCPDYYGDH